MISTEHGASFITRSAVLPMTICSSAVAPFAPSAIRSADQSRACFSISTRRAISAVRRNASREVSEKSTAHKIRLKAIPDPLRHRGYCKRRICSLYRGVHGSTARLHTRRASHRVAPFVYAAQSERQDAHQNAEGYRKRPHRPHQRQRAERRENGDEQTEDDRERPQQRHQPLTLDLPAQSDRRDNRERACDNRPCRNQENQAERRQAGPKESNKDRKSTRLNSSHLGISYAVF